MQKKLVVMMLLAVTALACGLDSVNRPFSAGEQTGPATATPLSTLATLPVVEDIETLAEETATAADVASATATPTATPQRSASDSLVPQGSGDGDDSDSSDSPASDATAPATVTAAPSATASPTPTPTFTPSPTRPAIAGEWPILPDATGLTTQEGALIYYSQTGVAQATAFYRAEMAALGWTEITVEEGVSLSDFLPEGIIPFEQGGRIVVVAIQGEGGQTVIAIGEDTGS